MKRLLVLICLLMLSPLAAALEENQKLWTGVIVQRPIPNQPSWLYSLFGQSRFINKSHPWEIALFEGGVGYQLVPTSSLWLGYRWSAHHPNDGFYQTNRLWQQLIWSALNQSNLTIESRTRLEEILRSHQSQPSFLFRQRVTFEIIRQYLNAFNPLYYDEMHFQLNRTDYTSHQFIRENRLFLGINLYTTTANYLQIGYLNQYEFSNTPTGSNKMNHVIAMNYVVN